MRNVIKLPHFSPQFGETRCCLQWPVLAGRLMSDSGDIYQNRFVLFRHAAAFLFSKQISHRDQSIPAATNRGDLKLFFNPPSGRLLQLLLHYVCSHLHTHSRKDGVRAGTNSGAAGGLTFIKSLKSFVRLRLVACDSRVKI